MIFPVNGKDIPRQQKTVKSSNNCNVSQYNYYPIAIFISYITVVCGFKNATLTTVAVGDCSSVVC